MKRAEALLQLKITKGRFYNIKLLLNDTPVQFYIERLPDVSAFRQLDTPDPDLMIRQLNPFLPVFYCKYELNGQRIHHVTNDLQAMIHKLQSRFILPAAAAV